jgi:transcription initiation factor TFIID subunit 6
MCLCVCVSAELAKYGSRNAANGPSSEVDATGTRITPLVKHVLSRELQLYFTRLTDALGTSSSSNNAMPGATGATQDMRDAALGSVRSDPGLHQLVPYLIGWGGEQVSNGISVRFRSLGSSLTFRRLPDCQSFG